MRAAGSTSVTADEAFLNFENSKRRHERTGKQNSLDSHTSVKSRRMVTDEGEGIQGARMVKDDRPTGNTVTIVLLSAIHISHGLISESVQVISMVASLIFMQLTMKVASRKYSQALRLLCSTKDQYTHRLRRQFRFTQEHRFTCFHSNAMETPIQSTESNSKDIVVSTYVLSISIILRVKTFSTSVPRCARISVETFL